MLIELLLVALGATVIALVVVVFRRRRVDGRDEVRPPAPGDTRADVRLLGMIVPTPLIQTDARGHIVSVNDACAREFTGARIDRPLQDWSSSVSEVLSRAATGDGRPVRETVVLGDPARAIRIIACRWGDGAIASLTDATEEVDFEEARRAFSAAVSHELRTPLARVLGLAETLALPDLDEDRTEIVEQIETEVDGMRRLIDEMLLLAALDRGRLAVADGAVDVCAVALDVVDDARQRRIGRGRSLTVKASEAITVPVSERLCEVVVQNLVDNALLHGGPQAHVTVSVVREGEEAVVVVADDGFGIGAQHLPFVFQRFYRGDASRTGPGSGLGLALVKHIVEAHGGSVVAESDGQTGTTLRVRLPVVAPADT